MLELNAFKINKDKSNPSKVSILLGSVGDQILEVNDEDLSKATQEYAASILKTTQGMSLNLFLSVVGGKLINLRKQGTKPGIIFGHVSNRCYTRTLYGSAIMRLCSIMHCGSSIMHYAEGRCGISSFLKF